MLASMRRLEQGFPTPYHGTIIFSLPEMFTLHLQSGYCTILGLDCFNPKAVWMLIYKFLRATTSHIPNSVLKDNRGSKVTIGRGGMLKIQHLVSVKRAGGQHSHGDTSGGIPQLSRIAYIEFFVKPEEDEIPVNDT
ncbi:hypothetical protein B296_00048484 [Ensete ventricosum]|uniref:Uncharacterized protein n=1 Tax=Ensete ventricosum TaxID=4639 RepID=A0A426YUJ8_ENSVE|nr:hypothetical protein B296_00048484 [Ensete ventricosum]